MKHYFTTIYRFMWEDLKLSGYTKEIFAVILGFFLPDRKPVPISFRVFMSITGASRSVIVTSIAKLEKRGFVTASHSQGKRTTYSISADTMAQYDKSMNDCSEETTDSKSGQLSNPSFNRSENPTSLNSGLVRKPDHHPSENRTGTRPEIGPHNINKYKNNIRGNTDIHVSEYTPSSSIKQIRRPVRNSD